MVLELGPVLDGKNSKQKLGKLVVSKLVAAHQFRFFGQISVSVGYPGMTDLLHGTFKSLDFIQELAGQGKNFDHFVAFDKAKCTVKLGCEQR